MEKYLYSYTGPVKSFDTILTSNWTAQTLAISESQARSNLSYRYKKDHGYDAGAKITLTGTIKLINQFWPVP